MKTLFSLRSPVGFSLLLIAVFSCKALVYLSILPPFEGWDEYQHVAYIAYLEEHHERPVLHRADVPRDLLRRVARYPAPKYMLDQIGQTGAVGYAAFFDHGFPGVHYHPDSHGIELYEAQQGSLYYRLMLPIMKACDHMGLLDSVFILRLINIILLVLSVSVILWLIRQVVPDRGHAMLCSLLVVSQPLLLLNGCRVTNDILAIATATIVIALGFLPAMRRKFACSIIAGLLIGLSCWAKSTSVILFPFWTCCLFLSWVNKEISAKRMLSHLLAAIVLALIVLERYFAFNIHHYTMLFVMQEAIVNRHKPLGEILNAFWKFPLITSLFWMWTKGSIWVGGWSFLSIRLTDLPQVLVVFSLLGWGYAAFDISKRKGILSLQNSFLCLFLCLCTCLTMSWHYLQSATAWGRPTTVPWYIGVCLPFFILFIYDSASRWSGRIGSLVGWSLLAIYVYADLSGSLAMISAYSGGGSGEEALDRLALLHPNWLGTPTLLVSAFLFVGLLALAVTAAIRAHAAWQPS